MQTKGLNLKFAACNGMTLSNQLPFLPLWHYNNQITLCIKNTGVYKSIGDKHTK